MPDNNDTYPNDDNTKPEQASDPLGIIGWVIAGKYKIHSYMGGGGFGEVYEGYNENLAGQRLVIKFFKRVQAREKFDKEAKILCMLDHANICRVIDYLPDEGAVVVSYIDGSDCGIILKQSGSLPEDLFIKVARGVTSAIAYAHEKKIAHRDIKPGNIIVDKNENVFLIDFGIAKEMGTDATKTAYTALTPMFAAPERQAGDRDYNPFISDIYEMGITLFNMATNSLPYRNPTNPLFEEWGGVAAKPLSPELTRILKKATHPDPAKRYDSAAAMAEDFKNLKAAFGRPRKKSAWPYVVLLVVVLAVAGYLERDYLVGFLPSDSSTREEATPLTTPPPPSEVEQSQSPITPDEGEATESVAGSQDEAVAEDLTPATPPRQEESPVQEDNTSIQQPDQNQESAVTQEEVIPEKTVPEETPPAEPIQEEIAVIEPEPEIPPPPPKSEVLIAVVPEDLTSLTVAGTERQPGQRFEVDPGRYVVVAVHPDFPVYRGNLDTPQGPVEVNLDLAELTGVVDTIGLQIALIPPHEHYILELKRNGRLKVIINFPYLGLTQMTGEWYLEVNAKGIGPAAGKIARVDSCVIFPFTPELRDAVYGNSGTIQVTPPQGNAGSPARLLIYWTEMSN